MHHRGVQIQCRLIIGVLITFIEIELEIAQRQIGLIIQALQLLGLDVGLTVPAGQEELSDLFQSRENIGIILIARVSRPERNLVESNHFVLDLAVHSCAEPSVAQIGSPIPRPIPRLG